MIQGMRGETQQASDQYLVLQGIPLETRVLEDIVTQRQRHFSQKVVATEAITVPDSEPQRASLDFSDSQAELEDFVEDGIQGVFFDFCLAFA